MFVCSDHVPTLVHQPDCRIELTSIPPSTVFFSCLQRVFVDHTEYFGRLDTVFMNELGYGTPSHNYTHTRAACVIVTNWLKLKKRKSKGESWSLCSCCSSVSSLRLVAVRSVKIAQSLNGGRTLHTYQSAILLLGAHCLYAKEFLSETLLTFALLCVCGSVLLCACVLDTNSCMLWHSC